MGIDINYEDNLDEVLGALANAIDRGFRAIGETAVGHAQDKVPVKTGNLKNSIVYEVDRADGKVTLTIGSNVEYAPYVELGTGIYAEDGRQTPWCYKDEEGVWHWTRGNKAQPFLKPAATEHRTEYINIMKDSLENA